MGRLTSDEYTLITMHPERSYEILKHVDHLGSEAQNAARYHQEKFDGTGYPHRLAGGEIPTEARVIAVADTYDAITSSRPYRAGQTHTAAMEEIRRVAGTQLDPEYVTILERLCGESMAWLEAITGKIDPDDG